MKFVCILCKSESKKLIATKTRDSNDSVCQCLKCSLIQLSMIPKEEEQKKFYDEDMQTKLILKKISTKDLEKRTLVDTQRRIEMIKKRFDRKSFVLDLGSGYGFFLKALKANGFKCIGLEISKGRRHISQKVTKVPVITEKIDSPSKTKVRYDLITLFHVIEHITDPVKLCQDLKTYLKENGMLIVEAPNAKDHMLLKSKKYQEFFWQRAHISYFTPKTLSKVLIKAGFGNIKITGIQRYSFENAIHWLRFGEPQLESPIYQTVGQLNWLEKYYKNYLTRKLVCDTLWIEARP